MSSPLQLTKEIRSLILSNWLRDFEKSRTFKRNNWSKPLTLIVLQFSKVLLLKWSKKHLFSKFYEKKIFDDSISDNKITKKKANLCLSNNGSIVHFQNSESHIIRVFCVDYIIDTKSKKFRDEIIRMQYTKMDKSKNYVDFGFTSYDLKKQQPNIKAFSGGPFDTYKGGFGVFFYNLNNSRGLSVGFHQNSDLKVNSMLETDIPCENNQLQMNDKIKFKIKCKTKEISVFVNEKSYGIVFRNFSDCIIPCIDYSFSDKSKIESVIKVELFDGVFEGESE